MSSKLLQLPANGTDEAVPFDRTDYPSNYHPVLEPTPSLELSVWRATATAIDLPGLTETLGAQLAGRSGAAALLLRQLRSEPARLETVGEVPLAGSFAPARPRSSLRDGIANRLVAFCLSGGIERFDPGAAETWIEAAVPDGTSVPCLIGPLVGPRGPLGVAVLAAVPGHALGPQDEDLLRGLLGPLAFALSQDRLVHAMERLEEAVEADRRALSQPLDVAASIIGAETGLREVMDRVGLVAGTDAPVLILGETGSGKEVVARAVHTGSRRRNGPVMRVNCGAISPDLVDSELFGHERGSFTGAVNDRKGWFERADGGTLFLDEVAELSLGAQVRLLRILQDGAFEKVGGHRTQTVDVRVVAATHRDLAALVGERRFREDLYYRINVFPIRLPPLRERRQDIAALAGHFARRAGLRLGASPLMLTADDATLLLAYDWPGNVRELAAVIERAAILGNGRRLDLQRALGGMPAPGRIAPVGPSSAMQPDAPFATLDQAMTMHLEAALSKTAGRIEGSQGAAKLLGINPHTLRARMRKLGVEWQRFRA
jgi:hydrogenase-4 transcriptional activator